MPRGLRSLDTLVTFDPRTRTCHGKRLRPEALAVKFAGLDIAEMSRLPLVKLEDILRPHAEGRAAGMAKLEREHPEKWMVVRRITRDLEGRLAVLIDLYSGPPQGLRDVESSLTRRYLFKEASPVRRRPRTPSGWLRVAEVTRNDLHRLDAALPLGVFTSVTGVSGSGNPRGGGQGAGESDRSLPRRIPGRCLDAAVEIRSACNPVASRS